MRDLDVVVEPVAVQVDPELRQLPLTSLGVFRRRHSSTTLAKDTTPLGSGH